MKKIIAIVVVLAGLCLLVGLRVRTPSQTQAEVVKPERVSDSQAVREKAGVSADRSKFGQVVTQNQEEPLPAFREWADLLSPESRVSKNLLMDWGSMVAISDIVLDRPDISDEELVEQVALKSGLSRTQVEAMVRHYPRSNLTLEEHYKMVLENEQLMSVKNVYDRLGIPFDPNSDCLLDGFRFAAGYLELKDQIQYFQKSSEQLVQIYSGEDVSGLQESVQNFKNEEIEGSHATIEAFYGRFVNRYGMDPEKVRALLSELTQVTLRGVGAFQLNVPRLPSRP